MSVLESNQSGTASLSNCPKCGKNGWHMGWCLDGPGPSPRGEAGIGFGKPEFDYKSILRKREEGERMVEEKLISAAASLARGMPEAWGQFMDALAGRVSEANAHLISSDLSSLQTNQGRAQAYAAMYRTFEGCQLKQEEIERRRSNG